MSRLHYFLRYPPFRPRLHFRTSPELLRSPQHLKLSPLQSRFKWSHLWYGLVGSAGVATGLGARQFAAPAGLLEPDTHEDKLVLESLGQDIDKLEIVQSLRKQSYNLHTDAPISAAGPGDKFKVKGWVEVEVDPSKDLPGAAGLMGALNGTRGLGVQRAFCNAETGEYVAVVWIGGGLTGWPGVAHGGVIATIFEEHLSRMVRGPAGEIAFKHRPTSLSVTYAKRTYTPDFYILRASFTQPKLPQTEPVPEPEAQPTKGWLSRLSPKKDLTKKVDAQQGAEVTGTLESVKGDLCVKVKSTFAVPGPERQEKAW